MEIWLIESGTSKVVEGEGVEGEEVVHTKSMGTRRDSRLLQIKSLHFGNNRGYKHDFGLYLKLK